MTIYVTEHALERYRERVAAYADAGKSEVVVAVRAAEPGNPYPHTVMEYVTGNHVFRYHAALDCVFVCAVNDDESLTVVTVRKPSVENRNWLNPKVKIQEIEEEAAPPPLEDRSDRNAVVAYLNAHEPENFADVNERRAWWLERQRRLQAFVAPRFNTPQQWKRRITEAIREACDRLTEIKPEYLEWKKGRHEALMRAESECTELYRPDGSMNWHVAMPVFLRRVEELERRVAELEGRK